MCLRVLAVLFLPSSRLRELFDSRAETLLGAAQRVFTMAHAGCPPSPLLCRRSSIHPTKKFRFAATKAPQSGSPWTSEKTFEMVTQIKHSQ